MPSSNNAPQRWFRLAVAVVVIVGIWGFVLPQLAKTEVVRQRHEFLEEHQINLSAMFYTEVRPDDN